MKLTWIDIAPSRDTTKALRHRHTVLPANKHHTCLYLVSVHRHLIAAYYLFNDPGRMIG